MLCLPGFGTHANTQNLPHFRAFPASIQEHSPQKCLFFMANAKLPNRPGFALLPPSTPWRPRTPPLPPPPAWAAPSRSLAKRATGGGGEEGRRGRGGKGFGLREGSSNYNGGCSGPCKHQLGPDPHLGAPKQNEFNQRPEKVTKKIPPFFTAKFPGKFEG